MKEYRRGPHTVFEIHLHLVWVTKYRRGVLTGEVGTRVRDIIKEICGQHEVTISRLVQRLKGKTAYRLLHEFPHLKKKFWGGHIWARGYFCCSSGNVTDEVVLEYIETQGHDDDANFKVEGEGPSEREPPSS